MIIIMFSSSEICTIKMFVFLTKIVFFQTITIHENDDTEDENQNTSMEIEESECSTQEVIFHN